MMDDLKKLLVRNGGLNVYIISLNGRFLDIV